MNIQPKPPKIKLVWNGGRKHYYAVVPTEFLTKKNLVKIDHYIYRLTVWYLETYAHIN